MEAYDAVAELYSGVFDSIELRQFEWPWLLKLIGEFKPRSILDLGCGNGYLAKALFPLVPRLYAVEPCEPLFLSARERLGKDAVLFQAPAENLPFNDREFDMVISLLSFRYMQWDKALGEIHRVLKPGGIFILIDLFASRFDPLYLPNYIETWTVTHLQHMKNRTYRKKLLLLSKNREWLKMTAEHPKRELSDAKACIREKFFIKKEKLLSAALGGKTVGLVCVKR
ncbi:hypothetical protein FACS1894147_12900 [Spirochaetia bacterium]|nr:hypothetical protein FACS1894147_12900 [Spirochaetia bacterium]